MPKIIFLYDGGVYKRGADDGRNRLPQTDVDSQVIFHDNAVPSTNFGGTGTFLHTHKYADVLADLEVGDEIIIGTVPDAVVLKSLWVGSHNSVSGFTADFDLVSIRDVYASWLTNGDQALGVPTFLGTTSLSYDFSNGKGDATEDAVQKAMIYGTTVSDFRNEQALQYAVFPSPVPTLLGESTYIRMTITALGEFAGDAVDGCCNNCSSPIYPMFQAGVLYDETCFQKQLVTKYCNCAGNACAGCSKGQDEVTVDPVTEP